MFSKCYFSRDAVYKLRGLLGTGTGSPDYNIVLIAKKLQGRK